MNKIKKEKEKINSCKLLKFDLTKKAKTKTKNFKSNKIKKKLFT